jgi:hypothetical protein
MKKIIAISVMLLLVAGAVFAQPSVGGNVRLGATLLQDKGTGDDAKAGGFWFNDANTKIEWSGDNAGGLMKLHSVGQGKSPLNWTPDMFAFVWWKPSDQFKIQLGQNADGDWGHAQISGWGFNGEAQASVAYDQDSAGENGNLNGTTVNLARVSGAWWGGYDGRGAAITISPIQGFDINLAIPFGEGSKAAADFYSNIKINFKYDLPDIGTIRLAADLKKDPKPATGTDNTKLIPDIYFAFYLSAIENMGIELGLSATGSRDNPLDKDSPRNKDSDGKPLTNDKLAVGIGYSLTADDLGLKARIGFIPKVMKDADGMLLGLELLPSYNLGALTVFVNFGFGTAFALPEGAEASYYTDFYFNPYIAVPLNAGKFYAGIKFFQGAETSTGKPDAKWSIPIGWNVYF